MSTPNNNAHNHQPARWKIIATGLLVLALVSAVLVYIYRESLAISLAGKVAAQRMADPMAGLPDGLHVGLCGTGSPFPDPQRAAPCTVVVAGQTMVLFDAGGNASRQLVRMGLNPGQLEHVFLTHFHSDHIDGLGELLMTRWAQQQTGTRLQIHGPPGVTDVVRGLQATYGSDHTYRTAHHGESVMPPALAGADASEFALNDLDKQSTSGQPFTVFQADSLHIEAFTVDHAPVAPAVGYRVSYKGRVVVISGDTAHNQNVAQAATGADLLVHEALHPGLVANLQRWASDANRPKLSTIFGDIPSYHASPMEVAETAQQAGVKAVVLTHIVPPLPLAPLREIFLEGTQAVYSQGPFRIGEDGDWISLLPNQDTVKFSRRWQR